MRTVDEIGIENRCFFIFHVRLATILIGFWQILVNLFIIAILMYILQYDTDSISNSTKSKIDDIINLISLGQRKDFVFNMKEKYIYYENPHKSDTIAKNGSFISSRIMPMSNKKQDYCVALSISVFTISFCVMMIVGSIKIKPARLMPYFCVEVFYFIINSLTLISEFSGMPLRSEYNKKYGHTTYYKWNNLNVSHRLNILVFIMGLMLLSLNLYLLNVIWACYKFLLRVKKGLELDHGLSLTSGISFNNVTTLMRFKFWIYGQRTNTHVDLERTSLLTDTRSGAADNLATTRISQQTLEEIEKEDLSLPKYEEVLLIPANANMPPPYYPTSNFINP